MKAFINFFIIFFLVFGVIGFKNGYDEVKSPDFLKLHVLNKAVIASYNNKYCMAYKRGDSLLYVFDVDSNKLIKVDRVAVGLAKGTTALPEKDVMAYINSSVPTLIGSGFVGYTLKDLFKNSQQIGQMVKSMEGKQTLLGIVGGSFSGYNAGHWLARKFCIPAEGSLEYESVLAQESNWIYAKDKLFGRVLEQFQYSAAAAGDAAKRQKLEERKAMIAGVVVNVRGQSHIDSKAIQMISVAQNDFAGQLAELPEENNDLSFLWWGMGVTAVLCVIFVLIPVRNEQKQLKKFNALGIPKGIDEAVTILSGFVKEADKEKFKLLNEKDFLKKSSELGALVNSTWNLKPGEKEGIASYYISRGITKPRDMQHIILRTFHRSLRGKEMDVEGQIASALKKYK